MVNNVKLIGVVFTACLSLNFCCLQTGIAFADDTGTIRGRISQALDDARGLGKYDIDIESRSGRIVLRGDVSSEEAKARIARITSEVAGVEEVQNLLVVIPTAAPLRAEDSELSRSVARVLSDLKQTMVFSAEAVLRGTAVELGGETNSANDRARIVDAVSAIPGVTKVVNHLTVISPSDAQITSMVQRAIAKEANINIRDLKIETQNGIVTISGKASSHRDVDAALAQALMADGVKDVKSAVVQSAY